MNDAPCWQTKNDLNIASRLLAYESSKAIIMLHKSMRTEKLNPVQTLYGSNIEYILFSSLAWDFKQ